MLVIGRGVGAMQSIRALWVSGARRFFDDAKEWGLTRRSALVIALIPVVLVGALVLIAALSFVMKTQFRPIFRFLTAEDSVLEWLQFLCIFGASAMFAHLGWRFLCEGQAVVGLLSLLLALGAFFVAGEEISWGQRIFGWGTPATLDEINHQGETNIHNIRWVQTAFGYMLTLGAMYCSLAPLVAAWRWNGRARPALSFLFIPALCLVPAFLMPFGYKMFRLLIWPGTDFTVVKFGEAPELCLYFGLLIFAALNVRRLWVTKHAALPSAVPTV
jgi:hypothetical protein